MQQAGTTIYKVDDMEFGRRLAVERELELPGPDGKIPGMWMNAIWDESGSFVIYPTLLGIKGQLPRGRPFRILKTELRDDFSGKHRNKQGRQVIGEGRDR